LNQKTEIVINVDSEFKPGSFEFLIVIKQIIDNTIVPVLAGPGITAAINLYTMFSILFGSEKSLVQLLRFLCGILPIKTEKHDGNVLVYKKDGTTLEVKQEAMVLFEDKHVRKAMGMAIAESLVGNGVDSVKIESGDISNTILKDERSSFSYNPDIADEVFDVETMEAELEIVSISFDPERKWEFRNYKETFTAEIVSKEFLKKIESGEGFKKGDRLKTILQTEYYKTQQQIRKKRIILEVIEHIVPAIQIDLF
jgi:hypothetical protein